ncbi:hypothetical protein ACO2Q8_06215 [Larkinella sp. VNQ87]|uniref:hypothetical protein n=1 Tax=Larkinella sp. VNQ87 TaxID=3400921 RepID=UPI003C005825
MKIVSIILILVSAFLSMKHGWDSFQTASPEQAKMMSDLGISKTVVPFVGAVSILIGFLLLFPQTFFISNLLNALVIVTIMALALQAGNVRMALIEIPFLALPLVLIWLKYPFKF